MSRGSSRLRPHLLACVLLGTGCTALLGYGDEARLGGGDELDAATGSSSSSGKTSVDDAAAADASSSGDGGPELPFCARSAHTFCASFDGVDPFAEWPPVVPENVLMLRDERHTSAPAAVLIDATREDPGLPMTGLLTVSFADTERPLQVDVAFSLAIAEATPAGAFAVLATPIVLGPDDGAPTYLIQLVGRPVANGRVALEVLEVQNFPYDAESHPTITTVAPGEWTRVEMRFVRGDAINSLEVRVDDASVLTTPLRLTPVEGRLAVSLGLSSLDTTPCHWAFLLDDVSVDLQ